MKIAYFHLAFLYSGGGEKLALKQVELLRTSGYNVDCFSPLVDEANCYPELIAKVKVREILPGTTKLFKNKPELGVILTSLIFPFIAYRFRSYDLVFGANQPSPIFGFILKILFNKPYIAYIAQPTRLIYRRPIDKKEGLQIKNTMHFLPHLFNILRPLFFWIDLKSIFCADKVLTNGEYMLDVLKNIYGINPTICSPGADIPENGVFDPTTTKHRDKPYLLVSNRHVPHKKIEYALDLLNKLEPKIDLVITGEESSYTTQLKSLVSYYSLERYVHFLGYVPEQDLVNLYQNCAIYLYTAPEEDFGMGVVEAMGYAKPVIAWNHAGPSRIITHSVDGYLVNFKNTSEVLQYVYLLLNEPAVYSSICQNAQNTVQNRFSWERNRQIMNQSIQELLPRATDLANPVIEPAFEMVEVH